MGLDSLAVSFPESCVIPRAGATHGVGDHKCERDYLRCPLGAVKSISSCVFHLEKRRQLLLKLRGPLGFSCLDSMDKW